MEDLEKRKRQQIEKYSGPIFENEAALFENVKDILLANNGKKGQVTYATRIIKAPTGMGKFRDARLENITSGSICIKKLSDTVDDEFILRKNVWPKISTQFVYWMAIDEDRQVRLAKISEDEVDIPIFSEEEPIRAVARLKNDKIKDTLLESIRNIIKSHKIFGEHADTIFGDFEEILALDPEKRIVPTSKEMLQIASLQATIEKMRAETMLKDQQIAKLQEMLQASLDFAGQVKKKPVLRQNIEDERVD